MQRLALGAKCGRNGRPPIASSALGLPSPCLGHQAREGNAADAAGSASEKLPTSFSQYGFVNGFVEWMHGNSP